MVQFRDPQDAGRRLAPLDPGELIEEPGAVEDVQERTVTLLQSVSELRARV